MSPQQSIAHYRIVSKLGEGGMGEVWRATDTKLGRDVAIKILPDAFAADCDRLARFTREAQVLASLNHPNIAAIYGVEERALVLELVDGPTLADRIGASPIPVDLALPIARQIAEALEYAHEKGLIHRDLKPANIKITPEGRVKVLDFGLAKAMASEASGAGRPEDSPTLTMRATMAGVILGTAAYMSPEQARGAAADKRSDIWSFGVVLYEMLAGRPLFGGETVSDTLAAVLKTTPDLTPMPAPFRQLVRRCLDKDSRRRLQAIGEARIALEDPLTGAPELPAQPQPRRPIAWIALAALFLLTSLVLTFLHFGHRPLPGSSLRATIALPANSFIHSFALSPDGGWLALALMTEGRQQLWVRAMDGLQARSLPGTEDAQYPFWLPDSRYIAFFAQGKLKKIPINGGPPQTLCDAVNARGGTSNRDGVILFAPTNGPLQRVSDAGGSPAIVKAAERGTYRQPVFLPDDRHFLYVFTAGDPSKDGVYLAELDAPTGRRLLPDLSSVAWAPSAPDAKRGDLLFIRDRSLMAQPFDLKTLRFAGDPSPIADKASFGSDNISAMVSASAHGILVYLYGRNLAYRQLTWLDRAGKELGKVGAPGVFRTIALSPDERTIAADHVTVGISSDLWLYDLARGTDSRFTYDPSINSLPIWSPDGRRVAFASNRAGHLGLFLNDAGDAGREQPLIQSASADYPSDWSRDGRYLLYVESDPINKRDLWILPLEGDRKPVPFLQTEFNEAEGRFSPDGRWVAYTSDESGRFEVYVRPYPPAPGKWKVSLNGGACPRWRSDGKELFFLTLDGKLAAAGVTPASRDRFEAAAPKELFDAHTGYPRPSEAPLFNHYNVAAGGQRFLMNVIVADTAESVLTVVTGWHDQNGLRIMN